MKPPAIKISERAQVVLILIAALAALALAWNFLLWPQFDKRSSNKQRRDELINSPFAHTPIEDLETAAANAQEDAAALDRDWLASTLRLATLANPRTSPARIDYQVEYAAVRKQIGQKAAQLRITLPATFNVDPYVTSTDVVRERLNQLKTVEKLLDLVFNQHISGITRFQNLKTILHHDAGQKLICEEYPVEIEFTTPFDALFYLFSGIFEEERVFVFSKIRVTSDPKIPKVLHVKAVMSSLVFP